MERGTIFKEKQRFTQWWLWLILLVPLLLNLFYYWQTHGAESLTKILGMSELMMGIIITLFLILRLETKITQEGWYYRFLPFQIGFRRIGWDEIQNAEIRNYNPVREYLGWGWRVSDHGTAYNVKGDIGLKLVLKSGKHILFGTQKPEDLQEALGQVGQLNRRS